MGNRADAVSPVAELLDLSEKKQIIRVCFVCSGNTCRSPMAEVLLSHMAKERKVTLRTPDGRIKRYTGVLTDSAGLAVLPGSRLSEEAGRALLAYGIRDGEEKTFLGRAAKPLREEMFHISDVVVAMTSGHLFEMMLRFPAFADRMICMPDPVPDPFGQGEEVYRECLLRIRDNLETLFFTGNETDEHTSDL